MSTSPHREFEKLLKESDHFRDVINTHREATAQIIGFIFCELVRQGKFTKADAHGMLNRLDDRTDAGNSTDTSRRYLVAQIRDPIKSLP